MNGQIDATWMLGVSLNALDSRLGGNQQKSKRPPKRRVRHYVRARQYGPQATIRVASRLGGLLGELACAVAASKRGYCRSQRRQVGSHRDPCFGVCLNLFRDDRRFAWMLESLWVRGRAVKLARRVSASS